MKSIDHYTKLLLKDKDLQNPNSFEELGYFFFGSLLFNFFIWLKSEVKDSDLLLFNSREGYFLKDIYELFRVRYNLPPGIYFKTSRKLSSIASLFTKDDIYNTFELHRYAGPLSNLMKDRFGIKCDKNDYVDTKKEIPNIDEYTESILENAKRIRKDYSKYINKIISNHYNIVMIDSGYQGTTQYNLQKAFGLNIKGRYISYKGNEKLSDVFGLYDFNKTNFQKNIIFFESIFTDSVGSYIDIVNEKFINEELDLKKHFFAEKIKIINGIKMFINDIFDFDFKQNYVSYKYSDYLFDLMCQKDFIKTESLFDIFMHDNYYVGNNIKKIVRK